MTTKKKPRAYNLKSRITSALRKLWQWSPMRKEALANARVGRGVYQCAGCGGFFGPKDVAVDHIEPVVSPGKGHTSWDDYISRLFCAPSGLQALCRLCHHVKTQDENKERRLGK